MNIFFDLDGVIRNLAVTIWGREPDEWDEEIPGVGHCDVLSWMKDHMNMLVDAPPTEYCKVIRKYNPIIMTCQPNSWKLFTEQWIREKCPEYTEIIYVKKIEDKIGLLTKDDWLVEDYPNFPAAVYQGNVLLIDKPYNRECAARERVFSPVSLDLYLKTIVERGY